MTKTIALDRPSPAADYPFASRYVKVNGHNIHYIEEGTGQPVLFIHGNPTSSYVYRNVIPAVAEATNRRCVAIDLLGFGKSDKPANIDYTLPLFTEIITGFVESLRLRDIILVAEDWGGFLGTYVMTKHPDWFQSAVLMETFLWPMTRMQGISLGPADLAASRRTKTTRVGGGHPAYQVIADPDEKNPDAPRPAAQQDPWHYTLARMVDACNSAGILPFYGPFGAIEDPLACQYQFRAAFLMGCVGTWTLHPSQIEIARREFSPTVEEVNTAKRIIKAMGDGTGTVMLDGRIQDDATFKQAQVMVQTASLIAKRDPEYAKLYGLEGKR